MYSNEDNIKKRKPGHNHGHSHGHSHGHRDMSGRRLLFSSILNIVITLAEIVGGILSNSLALLSDAIHNLGDTIAVLLAFFANRMSQKDPNEKQTFGYKRIEILTALLNAVILVVIIFFLFREAWLRFHDPEPVKGKIMFVVATVGLLANLAVVLILKKDSSKNINIRAAYIHILGDAISSIVVIVGSVFIIYFDIYWIDPVLTVLIGLYILKETYSIIKESIDILMQAAPKSIDVTSIQAELEKLDEIDNIHHVHVWNLTDTHIHFECHADLATDIKVSETTHILANMEDVLRKKFSITHVTIQFEHYCCEEKALINQKKKQTKSDF